MPGINITSNLKNKNVLSKFSTDSAGNLLYAGSGIDSITNAVYWGNILEKPIIPTKSSQIILDNTYTQDQVDSKILTATSDLESSIKNEVGDMKKSIYDIDNDGIIDISKTLDGLSASIAELNSLKGISGNIQDMINSLTGSINLKDGEKATYSTLNSTIGMKNGDAYIVTSDELHGNSRTWYVYNGTVWIYLGTMNIVQRNFITNPINLLNEIAGILTADHLDLSTIANSIGLNNKVDKVVGKQLSTEDFTTDEKNKIDSITGSNTGDETIISIKTKLGSASSTADGYLTSSDWIKFNSSAKINDGGIIGDVTEVYSIDKVISLLADKQNSIYLQNTKPSSCVKNDIWIDNTSIPYLIKVHNGTDFVQIGSSSGSGSGLLTNWNSGDSYAKDQAVVYNNKLYQALNDIVGSSTSPDQDAVNFAVLSGGDLTADNVSYSNTTTGVSADNVQSMLDLLFTNANSGKSLVAATIGSPSTGDETFLQLSNDIQTFKNSLSDVLKNKGITSNISNTLSGLSTNVNEIIVNSVESTTSLNVIAPYTKTITFSKPINIMNLCQTVLMYSTGASGVNEYSCGFNNTDSGSFNAGSNIVFDGTMHLATKQEIGDFINNGTLGSGTEWLSIDLSSDFNTIDNLIYNNGTVPSLTIQGTNSPVLTLANGNINLDGIDKLTQIIWTSNTSGTGVSLLIMSFDSGTTWKAFDGTNWNTVDISTLSDVKSKGMPKSVVNALTSDQLELVRNKSTILRFGYYLEMNNYSDIANTDAIQVNVQLAGTNSLCPSGNYTVTLSDDGTTLTYVFNTNGTYTINYVDSLS